MKVKIEEIYTVLLLNNRKNILKNSNKILLIYSNIYIYI